MKITKASGLFEDFNEQKLLGSIKSAGVSEDIGQKAVQLVKTKLSPRTDTHQIYHQVSQYLRQHTHPINQINYSLKRAVFALGPTGYPFERLFAKILQEFDYQTKVSRILSGKCVKHEIDVIAKKQNNLFYVECKFHNHSGIKTDIQAVLYTKARFDDIIANHQHSTFEYRSWLVSNTKFTKDAIAYAHCHNIKLTSWSFPREENLFNLIVTSGLHPITSLSTLSEEQIKILLKQDIVTLKDLKKSIKLDRVSELLPKDTITDIKREIKQII